MTSQPQNAGTTAEYSRGKGLGSRNSSEVIARYFDSMEPGSLLVVEDDLARRGDPSVLGAAAYVGDRVLRWRAIDDGRRAEELLREGSSGYPLNAFVIAENVGSSILSANAAISSQQVAQLARSVSIVIAAAFDGEAYLVVAISSQ